MLLKQIFGWNLHPISRWCISQEHVYSTLIKNVFYPKKWFYNTHVLCLSFTFIPQYIVLDWVPSSVRVDLIAPEIVPLKCWRCSQNANLPSELLEPSEWIFHANILMIKLRRWHWTFHLRLYRKVARSRLPLKWGQTCLWQSLLHSLVTLQNLMRLASNLWPHLYIYIYIYNMRKIHREMGKRDERWDNI